MRLDQFISDLLYHHDCVIVPGLGGFVVNYKPATINDIQNTFYPPSKSISFNKNLKTNDGLLANHIAESLKKEYSTANRLIEEQVVEVNFGLKQNKKWVFENIGSLLIDVGNNLLFEPDTNINYLISSYGLPVYQKHPIHRISIEEKITKEFKDRAAPIVDKKSSTRKWVVAAAITIPLTFFAIWIPSKYDLGTNINYAKLNPFTPDPQPVYENTAYSFSLNGAGEKSIKEQLLMVNEGDLFVDIALNNTNSVVVQLKETVVAEPVSTYVASSKKELHYHIVAGCFSKKSNAKKMVKKLKKEGYEAWIIGQRKGLWTVSYNSFVTRKEAVAALADAKTHNEKAWVLNY